MSSRTSYLPGLCPVTEAVEALAIAESEARGAIFTKREVVDFILDLVGYTSDVPLHRRRLLEPSFGGGDFLFAAVERLMVAWKTSKRSKPDFDALLNAIRAVEIHRGTYSETRRGLLSLLARSGLGPKKATELADAWLIQGDFLLAEIEGRFDFVVGNPPYVRQELIPAVLVAEYRSLYHTIYDRADLYIPFIERGLSLLSRKGKLGFICADRWMKNKYGGPLRNFIAERFRLDVFVDMVDTPAFHSDVIAYPAVMVMSRGKQSSTRVAAKPAISVVALSSLAAELCSSSVADSTRVKEIFGVARGAEPWILESTDRFALVRRLEQSFASLEEVGCKVGIGVATGADRAFIGRFDDLDVEGDRKLPLAMTRDIDKGTVQWRGFGVINPYADDGKLVDLQQFPKLKRYLEQRKDEIAGRHVAKKSPSNWYRTIDRIYPELTFRPKLLIPDIKGDANVVFEPGNLYPHHNLYYITSDEWDLEALQAVLLSGIAKLFVSTYSTRMRGGYLRFQAQYLRRIRIPRWDHVPTKLRRQLINAGRTRDQTACDTAVYSLYGLDRTEQAALAGGAK